MRSIPRITPLRRGNTRWLPFGIATVALVAFVLTGVLYSLHERRSLLDRASDELLAVSSLQGDHLAAWYEDELNDIAMLATNGVLRALHETWRKSRHPEDGEAFIRHLESLRQEHGYRDLFICNHDGSRQARRPDSTGTCNPVLRELLRHPLPDGRALTTDLYRCPLHDEIHLDFLSGFGRSGDGSPIMLVGRFNAAEAIYRSIDRWPTSSKTAEIYLVRREGDSIRVLSRLRHLPASALAYTYALGDTSSAAVKAVKGHEGFVEARDYRGVEVLSYVRGIPSTPWYMVTKIDREEVLAEMYPELVLFAALLLTSVLALTTGAFFWSGQRQTTMYRAMFEDHASVKLLIDPRSGTIVDANHAAAAYYGWPREELRRMRIHDINTLPPEQVSGFMRETVDGGRLHHEFRHRRADGSIRDVEVFAGSLRIRGSDLLYSIVHDVTERKEAEHSIRLLGRSVEQSPVTIVITNPEGEIQYVNPEFTKVTGFTPEEVLGRKTSMLSSGLHDRDFYTELWSTIISGEEWIGEFQNRKKNGELFWERAIISPVISTTGSITHFVGIKTDITSEKAMLAELVGAKEKAEESDRLKSAFLANMSHEIRTPINSVVGFADLLTLPDLSDADREEYTAVIRQRSYDLLNIIDDILDISRIEAGVVKIVEEQCSIRELLQDLHVMYVHQARASGRGVVEIRFENLLTDGDDRTVTDAARVRQVLTNLLSNALKFTQSGSVVFGCRVASETELLFHVTDTGIGIDADVCRIIFDRFRQADESSTRRYGGTGLGLAICQGIVHLLGGRIWVESEPGKGSSFYFTIPRRRESIPGVTI